MRGGGSGSCSVGSADGSTDGVLLGTKVGILEGKFNGGVFGLRLGTKSDFLRECHLDFVSVGGNHDGKTIGAKVGKLPDGTEGMSEG